jgi:uncharacterized repeat protein (TIGR01451 family)
MPGAMRRMGKWVCLGLVGLALFAPALSAVAQVVIPEGPNPVLSKMMKPARPRIGELAWIVITARNAGSANADNVIITDPIPDNMVLRAVYTTQGAIQVNQRIVTIYAGTLAPGQTMTVTNDVVLTREFAADTPYTNCTGLTYRDGTARLACFPYGPAFNPVSVTTPPSFLPDAGADTLSLSLRLFLAGAACLFAARRLRRT